MRKPNYFFTLFIPNKIMSKLSDRPITCHMRWQRKSDCKHCRLKPRCCPNTPTRKIARSVYEDARDVARAIMQTPEYWQSRCERKKVEMLFAHLKRILKLNRLRLRGPSGAHDEFLLAATAQNLRRLAKQLGTSALNLADPAI